ncbi:spermatogenesis-associated protein 20, partial [Homalodisca vitripennis]
YPWGEEAFEKAQKEDKLIFLSVGYSTCHWCHVMERESFENEDIAKIMNEHFVNIKVDREERPDVDKVYMTFVQACSGSGGWPMSVFLKPDLKPVSGGTYYPPEDKYGRRGFKSELLKWVKEWKTNKAQWSKLGDSVTEVIRNATVFEVPMSENLISGVVPGAECWQLCMEQLSDHYEPTYGGFGLAPKFPQPGNLVFLFHAYARNPTDKKCSSLKDMGLHTLKMMARGGIHDHIAQGRLQCGINAYLIRLMVKVGRPVGSKLMFLKYSIFFHSIGRLAESKILQYVSSVGGSALTYWKIFGCGAKSIRFLLSIEIKFAFECSP